MRGRCFNPIFGFYEDINAEIVFEICKTLLSSPNLDIVGRKAHTTFTTSLIDILEDFEFFVVI